MKNKAKNIGWGVFSKEGIFVAATNSRAPARKILKIHKGRILRKISFSIVK